MNKDTLVTIAASLVLLSLIAAAQAEDVAFRNAGGIVMSATPQAVGTPGRRSDLVLNNDGDSTTNVWCGYRSAAINQTPGPSTGFKLRPGDEKRICIFPDQIIYCMTSTGGTAVLYYDEARLGTPTPTP